jgi:hypothetical protein
MTSDGPWPINSYKVYKVYFTQMRGNASNSVSNSRCTVDFRWSVNRPIHGKSTESDATEKNTSDDTPGSDSETPSRPPKKKWIWFYTDDKYFHELGFLAAFVQYWAATIFWISGSVRLPLFF